MYIYRYIYSGEVLKALGVLGASLGINRIMPGMLGACYQKNIRSFCTVPTPSTVDRAE